MKQILTLLFILFIINTAHAQAPQGIPYQASARSSTGAILASTPISVRFTIRDSIATGAMKYRETHTVTTDANGMFSLVIGQGTPISGTFAAINWGQNAKFQQVEMDPTGGASFTDMGTQQMLSVPYSIYSNNGLPAGVGGDIIYHNGTNWVKLSAGLDGKVLKINGGLPVWSTDSISNTSLLIGSNYGGGKIAYILQPGDPGFIAGEIHGLIAAPMDQSTGIQWGCTSTLLGSTLTTYGTGAINTSIIHSTCGSNTAAQVCSNLLLGGFSDWHLPSIGELQKIFINYNNIPGLNPGYYWSSSESGTNSAYFLDFNAPPTSGNSTKNGLLRVRAVRIF